MTNTVAAPRQKAAPVLPFALRARLISPLADGSFLDLADGVIGCDAGGRIDWVGAAEDYAGAHPVVDLRPVAIIPGLVDTHAHLPQIPITGLADSRSLIGWLDEMMAPAERRFSGAACFDDAQTYFSAFAAVGTTTAVLYGSVDAAATDASFRAAADHGLRVILGQCLMDRMRYDDAPEAGITERRLAESESLCRRWHGYDAGRLGYAFTPRFALSCSSAMLQESARMAADLGAYWQTHLAEDTEERGLVLEMHKGALDYLDVYDRAGALGRRAIFAHAVHLSAREITRLVETGSVASHCPSNVFGIGGLMDLGGYRERGVVLGLGSDVGGCSDLSLFKAMELGWVCQAARQKLTGGTAIVTELEDWFRLATLDGARSLGLGDRIGSLEAGKEADLVAVDIERLRIVAGGENDNLRQVLSSMIFRRRPDMIRDAWVRGRRVAGPGMFDEYSHI